LAILPWAEQALGAVRGLRQAAHSASYALTGEFRLYAIPAALPLLSLLRLIVRCWGIRLTVSSRTSPGSARFVMISV